MDSGEVIFAKVTDVIGKTGMYYKTNQFSNQAINSFKIARKLLIISTLYHNISSLKHTLRASQKLFLERLMMICGERVGPYLVYF